MFLQKARKFGNDNFSSKVSMTFAEPNISMKQAPGPLTRLVSSFYNNRSVGVVYLVSNFTRHQYSSLFRANIERHIAIFASQSDEMFASNSFCKNICVKHLIHIIFTVKNFMTKNVSGNHTV